MGTKGGQEWSGSAFTSEKDQTAKRSSPTSFKFMANATEWNNSRAFMSNDMVKEQLESTHHTQKNYMDSTKDARFFTKHSAEDADGSEGGFFKKMGLSDKLKKFRDGFERKKEWIRTWTVSDKYFFIIKCVFIVVYKNKSVVTYLVIKL